ncbi:hypothetical protein LZ31DRAFT_303711 [Colletotrichum somersetense]|nr:hypothetical protein LZ31DRAFT_303711 [Colletotrichum somersetense]
MQRTFLAILAAWSPQRKKNKGGKPTRQLLGIPPGADCEILGARLVCFSPPCCGCGGGAWIVAAVAVSIDGAAGQTESFCQQDQPLNRLRPQATKRQRSTRYGSRHAHSISRKANRRCSAASSIDRQFRDVTAERVLGFCVMTGLGMQLGFPQTTIHRPSRFPQFLPPPLKVVHYPCKLVF